MTASSSPPLWRLDLGSVLMKDHGRRTCLPLLDDKRFQNRSLFLSLDPRQSRRRPAAQAVLMADSSACASRSFNSYIGSDPLHYGARADTSYIQNKRDKKRRKDDEEEEEDREIVTAEKLDQWLRDSIAEIVKNIGEAPFLMHVFSGGHGGARGGSNPIIRLERETASPEVWSRVTRRWGDQGSHIPDGIVLVEELKDEEDDDGDHECANKTWGLVVQGRGVDSAACYILNTSRVRSSSGFCTHFFLVRAKCFGETTAMQLQRAWLQQGRRL